MKRIGIRSARRAGTGTQAGRKSGLDRKQLFALFVCSLVPWTVGNGIAPLLPTQAAGLGASPAMAGYCLSLSQLAMAAGTLGAGWLSERLRRRKRPAIVAAAASIPALYLMGQVRTLWGLAAALTAWFFCAGMVVALVSIAAGLSAAGSERGKVFGLLALTAELGALLGGALGGPIADRHGYATMYAVLSMVGIVAPLAGLFWAEGSVPVAENQGVASTAKRTGLGRNFYILFVASLGAAVAAYVFFLGRSFAMAERGFTSGALSAAGAVGGLLALPFPLLAGWLSDRLGRKRLMALSFVSTTAGLLALHASTSLWHFWAASTLFTLSFTSGPVGSALVADLVPQTSVGKGLAMYGATTWMGGIAGCMITGCATQCFGLVPTLLAGACVPLAAVGLLGLVRHPTRAEMQDTAQAKAGSVVAANAA